MIKSIAIAINPGLYQTRALEAQVEKISWKSVYPIFYYNVPMFPGEKLALHLFEPRYKLMMTRVVDTIRAFAYVPNFSNYSASKGVVATLQHLYVSFFSSADSPLSLLYSCLFIDKYFLNCTLSVSSNNR